MTEVESDPPMSRTTATNSDQADHAPASRATSDHHHPEIEIWIRHRSGWVAVDWKEIVAHHELLFFLIWRDISARYKQTMLGGLWAVVQPLMMMTIFSLVFGRLTEAPAGFPYPVFVFAGLIPWTLFSQGFSQASLSLVSQQQLLTKVYFPRIFIPVAAAAVFLVDLLISLFLYGFILAFYGITPAWTVVFVPPLIVMTYIATLSLGLIISALTVFYRDFRHLVPFMSQILLYASPVIIPTEKIPLQFRPILAINPIFGIIDAFRAAILGTPCDYTSLAISTTSALFLFTFGVFYFCRTERKFADFA